jgi:arginine decarboxylase
MSVNVNSMGPLDNLCHPVSVVKEVEKLTVEAFKANYAFLWLMVTVPAVQAMVLVTYFILWILDLQE